MAGTHHSNAEARQKLKDLLPHEWQKVAVYARFLAKRSRTPRNPRELMNEAVLRTLEGRRRWKVGMDGPSHLFGVMKSVLFSWNKADRRAGTAMAKLTALDDYTREIGLGESDIHSSAELRQALDRLRAEKNLSQDERAVLDSLAEGESPEAVISELGNDKRRYRGVLLSLAAYLTKDGE